jgi:hypothetical protein
MEGGAKCWRHRQKSRLPRRSPSPRSRTPSSCSGSQMQTQNDWQSRKGMGVRLFRKLREEECEGTVHHNGNAGRSRLGDSGGCHSGLQAAMRYVAMCPGVAKQKPSACEVRLQSGRALRKAVVMPSSQMANEGDRRDATSVDTGLDRDSDPIRNADRTSIWRGSVAQLPRPVRRAGELARYGELREPRQLVRLTGVLPMWVAVRPQMGTQIRAEVLSVVN